MAYLFIAINMYGFLYYKAVLLLFTFTQQVYSNMKVLYIVVTIFRITLF